MSYLGSKAASGVYQKIIAEMPPHDTYIETHLGGGAIMLRKPPARHNIGIDKDEEALTNFMEREGYGQIPNLQLVNRDAVDVLEKFFLYPPSAGNRVLLYVDPPYLHETRTSNARYRCEYQVADHVRLLTCLKSLPPEIRIILSGYPSQLYEELLPGWRSKEFQAMTRGGVRTEKIWMNYPEGAAYSHKFAGKDYNDRHRIKRKAERWRAKYAALPPAERLAIMVALNEVDAGQ
ncbi:phage DNA methylase [Enterobacter hormaechei]|uniref:DNA adenine methylase n=1 Tax=Enterobacter cloacae complex TaxID=354276 RepID=UPI0007923022|nr:MULTISPECIES: DNA adenine methylase [Enterobacter cloacae complex]DAI71334.1 MAG TPA: DNA adenine methylase [Caudoviricetes sp.]MCW3887668.1 DNA adenine methylase [Enterobacter hormaechei subsp. hoffmannii]OWS95370.1 DNA methylase [Enterobacter kobei]QLP52281.1 DNA adenine methylase [Enterobacter hormaechei]QLP62277.1 DNA adenine methylase [Enterobacter hormaechei]